jgi:diacylglycerol kinase (ATP)
MKPAMTKPNDAPNPYKVHTGFSHFIVATKYSYQGLWAGLKYESSFRQEAFAACVMFPAAWWLGKNWLEISFLAALVILCLAMELINSAIEAVVDRNGYEWNEFAKLAKDYGSAAMHLCLMLTGGVWLTALCVKMGWV